MFETKSPDNPVLEKAHDALGRWPFAEDVVTLIESIPENTSIRVGIYGSWGTGKTSILSFVQSIAKEKGYLVVQFDPWKFHDHDELWIAFAQALESALCQKIGSTISWNKTKIWTRKIFNKGGTLASKFEGTISGKIASSLYDLIKGPANSFLEPQREKIEKRIKDVSAKRKMIVVIDDLDRTGPELLPDILMHLRSVLNLKGCIYILGLDPKVVGTALGGINQEWADGYSFLEKIVEYPRWLPEPTKEQWEALLSMEAEGFKNKINLPALLKIIDFLPKNPRRLKLFLRHIVGLKPKIDRYSESEIDLASLYLAQILKLEFPENHKNFLSNEEFCQDICFGRFGFGSDENKKKEKEEKFKKQLKKYLPTAEEKKERFSELIFGLKEHYNIIDDTGLKPYFYFLEREPILTWKEYHYFLQEWTQSCTESEKQVLLQPYLNQKKCSYFFQKTLEYRHRALGEAVDQDLEDEIKEKLRNADVALDILTHLVKPKNALSKPSPLLGAENFFAFLSHAKHWARFKGQEYYELRRQRERDFLKNLINNTRDLHVDFLEKLLRDGRDSSFEKDEGFEEFEKSIKNILEESTAKELLNIFKTPSAFETLWGENKHYAYKNQLLKSGSYFHTDPTIKSELMAIADHAKIETGIQSNFYDCFRMVSFYTLNPPYAVTMDNVRDLIKTRKDFMGMIWKAGTAKRLNRRMVGTLSEMHKNHEFFVGAIDHLPFPKWWDDVMQN